MCRSFFSAIPHTCCSSAYISWTDISSLLAVADTGVHLAQPVPATGVDLAPTIATLTCAVTLKAKRIPLTLLMSPSVQCYVYLSRS